MFLAVVDDKKGIQSQKLYASYPSLKVHGIHSSFFEGHSGMVLNRMCGAED